MSSTAGAIARAVLRQRAAGQLAVIAEIKVRRHDGLDLLRDRQPETIASAYAHGGAAAISVVTGRWFGGSIQGTFCPGEDESVGTNR